MTHKLVTAGCPCATLGNEPSSCCCVASQASPRSTELSTCAHSAAGKTAASDLAGTAVRKFPDEPPSVSLTIAAIKISTASKAVGNPMQKFPLTNLISA